MEHQQGQRRWRGWQMALAALAFFVPFFIRLPVALDAAFWQRLMDAAHLPAFGVLAGVLARVAGGARPGWQHFSRAFAGAALAAGAVELVQEWTGREASFGDFLYSVAGAFIGVAGWAAWRRGTGWRLAVVLYAAFVAAAVLLPAWRLGGGIALRAGNFPVLADFEEVAEIRMWRADIQNDNPYGSHVSQSREGVAHGTYAGRIAITQTFDYPGIRLFLADQDWRGYRELAFEVFNPGTTFELSLRVDDNQVAYPRFYRAFAIPPGRSSHRVSLEEIQRGTKNGPLNLGSMRRLIFFLDNPRTPRVFFLDWVRLE